jgi:hypothetical protein
LTVLAHELGHVIGLEHADPADEAFDVMVDRLGPGVRRMPGESAAIDRLFAEMDGTV